MNDDLDYYLLWHCAYCEYVCSSEWMVKKHLKNKHSKVSEE